MGQCLKVFIKTFLNANELNRIEWDSLIRKDLLFSFSFKGTAFCGVIATVSELAGIGADQLVIHGPSQIKFSILLLGEAKLLAFVKGDGIF